VSELMETRLADLAAHVELPPAPDLATRVRARVEVEPPRRAWRLRPALAVPLALLALSVGGVAAVPSARSAVLRWLGIEGVRIERVPKAPTPAPTSSAPGLELGERTTLARGTLVPSALGRPDAVYAAGERVTLLYRPRRGLPESEHSGVGALLSQFPGRIDGDFVRKEAGPDTTVDAVRIRGEQGFWLGGAPHGLSYMDPSGAFRESPTRLAGPTLVWRRGSLTLRLEADVTKERALEIARSIR
jgi:hypothetical protein